jgi:hypothetical protein
MESNRQAFRRFVSPVWPPCGRSGTPATWDNHRVTRTPPSHVRRQLRREVGFACPVAGCMNPYLTWHHFDPPWHVRQHHETTGLIALCRDHHAQADEGAFTIEQLRQIKGNGATNSMVRVIRESFNWRRQRILCIVGGNFLLDCLQLIWYRDQPCIWLTRDDESLLSINIRMLTTSPEPRLQIESNGWICSGVPQDLECPPSGKSLRVRYANGDELEVKFSSFENAVQFKKHFTQQNVIHFLREISFPITAVEISGRVGGTSLRFSSTSVQFGMNQQAASNFIAETPLPALRIIHPEDQLSPFMPSVMKFMLLPPIPPMRLSMDID